MGNSEYELLLPVYKRGDDLAEYLDEGNTPPEALLRMAEQYEDAAQICRRVASKLVELKGPVDLLAVGAHTICITTQAGALDDLLPEEIVRPYQGPSEDEDFYSDETLPEGATPEYLISSAGAWFITEHGKPQFGAEGVVVLPLHAYANPASLRDAEDLLWEAVTDPEKIDFGVRLTDSLGRVGLIIFLTDDA